MAKSTTTTATATAGGISAASSSPSSPTVRFLTHLTLPEKPPDPNTNNGFDLHESDVVWSSSSSSSDEDVTEPPSPANVSSSPPIQRLSNSGLYAALSDDQLPFVRRKPSMSPSQSAATAARTIPPVALRRSSEIVNYHQSAPVNVPVWPRNKTSGYLGQFDDLADEDAEEEDEGEMIPPHEIVARSYVTFSVFEGAGRTLKGRDLCRVRNAVFQKTGFID